MSETNEYQHLYDVMIKRIEKEIASQMEKPVIFEGKEISFDDFFQKHFRLTLMYGPQSYHINYSVTPPEIKML